MLMMIENGIDSKSLKYTGALLDALRGYYVGKKEASDKYTENMTRIDKVYIKDTDRYKEVVATAKEEYDNALTTLKQEASNNVKGELNKLKEDLKNHVAVPIPAELMQHIDYLEKYGKNLTVSERNLIVEQCKGNFQAIRAANQYIEPHVNLQNYDELVTDLQSLEKFSVDFVNGKTSEYMTNLMLYGGFEKSVNDNLSKFFGDVVPENNE